MLKPNTAAQIESKQLNQKISHDNSVQPKQFANGRLVLVRVYNQQCKWTRGKILRSTGPVSYIVKLSNGLTWRRHQDQLKSCSVPITVQSTELPETVPQDMLSAPSTFVSSELPDSVSSNSDFQPSAQLAVIHKEHVNFHESIHLTHILTLNIAHYCILLCFASCTSFFFPSVKCCIVFRGGVRWIRMRMAHVGYKITCLMIVVVAVAVIIVICMILQCS